MDSRRSYDKRMLCCSFCGKQQNEVVKLIAGPQVYICDECIECSAAIIKEELEREGRSRADRPVDVLTRLLGLYPELAEMSLLDFLRQYNGSPAISQIKVGDVIGFFQKAIQGSESNTPFAPQYGQPPVEDSAGDGSGILWKLKGVTGLTYNFHGFSALQKWASNLPNGRDAFVSIDGKEWKRYGDLVDTISMAKGAGREISPITAFRMTPSLPPGVEVGGISWEHGRGLPREE